MLSNLSCSFINAGYFGGAGGLADAVPAPGWISANAMTSTARSLIVVFIVFLLKGFNKNYVRLGTP